jgi:xanthine dehydrogenase accessory factor
MAETGLLEVPLDLGEGGGEVALTVAYATPLRLLILGGVHIAQALVALAPTVGLTPTIIDPRGGFASPERFPDVPLLTQWPDEAVAAFGIDARTAVVALTHDEKLDDPALLAAFASKAFYIGALGSRRTQAARGERMLAAGVSEADYARLHGPIGLDIGAANPPEIALAILAEIVAKLRGKT